MTQGRFLLLLAIVAIANAIMAAEGHSIRLEHEHVDDGSKTTEERGVISSLSSKVKNIFGKSTRLTNKLESLEKNQEIAAAIAKNPSIKKLETAAIKDPSFFTKLQKTPEPLMKLAKDPEVGKISTALKNSVKLNKNDVNSIRAAVANDPVKVSKLKETLKAVGWLTTVVGVVGFTGLLVYLLMKGTGGLR